MSKETRAVQLTEAARQYRENHHWVPLRLNGKAAAETGWPKRTLADAIPKFKNTDNIGILLGEPSDDLVRLDADFPAIPAVTAILFPEPTLTSGRASSPLSGRMVTCAVKSTNFKLPDTVRDHPRLPLHDDKPALMVFQIQSTGAQAMVPPSIHPDSQEEIIWRSPAGVGPMVIDAPELLRRVGIEAFLMAVRQFWPARPSRNEAAMALSRVLLEALSTHHPDDAERCAIVDRLVVETADAGGDGEASRKGKARAEATLKKMRAGKNTTGMTRLVELLNLPADVAETFREWLGTEAPVARDKQYELNMLHGADLTAKQLKWLWPGRIPLGTFVTLIGVPAAGKSNVFLDIAARVTTGRDMPPGNARISPPADVLLFCTEDQPEQTIIPRLLAMGGDKSRLHIVTSMKSSDNSERGLDLTQDVAIVERYLEAHPEVQFVVFDPISEFLGAKIDSHNNSAVRFVLGPLMKILHRRQIACVCVTHMAKTKALNVQSAAIGSQGFSSAPRGSLMVSDEMEDAEQDDGSTKREPTGRKLLSVNMGNLAPPNEMKTLAFNIETEMLLLPDGLEIKISSVKWGGEVEITAWQIHEEAKPKSKAATEREKATRFIMREMTDPEKPGEWRARPANEMNALAGAQGITNSTLDRARSQLRVVAKQGKMLGMPGRGDVWWWVHEERRY